MKMFDSRAEWKHMPMLLFRRIIVFVACVALAPLASAQSETVRIGFACPLTGPQAHYGEDNLRSARMAIDELMSNEPGAGEPLQRELAGLWKYRVRRFRVVYA